MTNTHFDRLGLPRRFDLVAADLEREYLARSREAHPDNFQLGSDVEQRASLELSSALNEAYAVLRDPFRRAEYLLQLEGGPSASQMKEMPAPFLEEMLDLRMEIEEVKRDPDSLQFQEMEDRLAKRYDKMLEQVGSRFATQDGDQQKKLREIRTILNAAKYVQGLMRDLHGD